MANKGGHRWNPTRETNPAWKDGPIKDRDWVVERYVNEGMSIREVAQAAGCALRTAARWLSIHGIPTRDTKAAMAARDRGGERNPKWRGGMPRCLVCGKERSRGTKSMCHGCFLDDARRRRGPLNHTWKGTRDVKSALRHYLKSTWTKAVFERDRYTCCGCGDARGGNLHAHHVRRLAVIVDPILETMSLDTAMERWEALNTLIATAAVVDIENGITLCKSCHEKIHLGPFREMYPLEVLHGEG